MPLSTRFFFSGALPKGTPLIRATARFHTQRICRSPATPNGKDLHVLERIERLEKQNEEQGAALLSLRQQNEEKDASIKEQGAALLFLRKQNEEQGASILFLRKQNEEKDASILFLRKQNEEKDAILVSLRQKEAQQDADIKAFKSMMLPTVLPIARCILQNALLWFVEAQMDGKETDADSTARSIEKLSEGERNNLLLTAERLCREHTQQLQAQQERNGKVSTIEIFKKG